MLLHLYSRGLFNFAVSGGLAKFCDSKHRNAQACADQDCCRGWRSQLDRQTNTIKSKVCCTIISDVAMLKLFGCMQSLPIGMISN